MLDLKYTYIKRWVRHFLFQILACMIIQIHHLNCRCEYQYHGYNTFGIWKGNKRFEEFSVIISKKYLLRQLLGWPQSFLEWTFPAYLPPLFNPGNCQTTQIM